MLEACNWPLLYPFQKESSDSSLSLIDVLLTQVAAPLHIIHLVGSSPRLTSSRYFTGCFRVDGRRERLNI